MQYVPEMRALTFGGEVVSNCSSAIYVGCAGWSLSSAVQEHFPAAGSHLVRYAAVLTAVEINTSFYRPHRPATYERWRDSVPEGFRFAAKVPKAITHEARLRDIDDALERFIEEVSGLAPKLGCLLVQLPPSLQYDPQLAGKFFRRLRGLTSVNLVCEPRHTSWFTTSAAAGLAAHGVSLVFADPPVAPLPDAASAAGVLYIRLHGSPVIYHSNYEEDRLVQLAEKIGTEARSGREVWVVFDNTASGAAVPNALSLLARLRQAELAPA